MARTSEPAVLFIGIGGRVLALDRRTGAEIWRTKVKGATSTVILHRDGDQLYASASGELFCLDPATGEITFANAGHVAPLVISGRGVDTLTMTDMVVGLFAGATYRDQKVTLESGDSIVLFTDGVTEAENEQEDQLGLDPIASLVSTLHGAAAPKILETIAGHVQTFAGNAPVTDDVTMLALTRL